VLPRPLHWHAQAGQRG
jgi:hypothetical protein